MIEWHWDKVQSDESKRSLVGTMFLRRSRRPRLSLQNQDGTDIPLSASVQATLGNSAHSPKIPRLSSCVLEQISVRLSGNRRARLRLISPLASGAHGLIDDIVGYGVNLEAFVQLAEFLGKIRPAVVYRSRCFRVFQVSKFPLVYSVTKHDAFD
jgi:hypothetical protein